MSHIPTEIEEQIITLKYGNLKLKIKKNEAFVYYATFVAGENNKIRLSSHDVVIDAGANIGDFTLKAAKKVKKGKVIAIEPNPKNVEIINQNIIINKLENVEVLPFALSNVSGTANLSGDTVGASIMEKDENVLQIRTITIDDVLEKYCTKDEEVVLKMDIEGAEELVFRNPDFLKRIREISIELHGENNIRNIPLILSKYNFIIEEFKLKQQIINTIKFIIKHPISFISSEQKTGRMAFNGLVNTIYGRNPVPSIGSEEFKLIYAKKHKK